jgi:hypothetical protein
MNDKIKDLLSTAYKTDSIEKNKWRIENREQLREQRKKELKELMEKDKTMSNNKQSSVDWLIEHYTFADLTAESWEMIQQKAKAMHKEECINLLNTHNDIFDSSEDHYNKTFNK